MALSSRLGWIFVLALVIGSHPAGNDVRASTITVPEREIHSLANAPEVLGLAGATDDAGRPFLVASLRFANDCYADTGARLLAGKGPAGPPHAIILQRINPEGCPDIFQPTERRVTGLLPVSMAGDVIRVVGKPAPPEGVRRVDLASQSAARPEGPSVLDFEPFASGAGLPAYELEQLTPDTTAGRGYMLTGRASLAEGCGAGVVRARVFEVPDASGAPSFDVIVLTAPERCATGGREVDLGVTVATPQPPAGRFVYIVNEPEPSPRPLG